jgi:hypothetical protein
MISVKRTNFTELQPDAVLLVDTTDNSCYKLISHENPDDPGICATISNMDPDELEHELGTFIVADITVGQPLLGVGFPAATEPFPILKTAPVTRIEIYQDEEAA